jgi:hypothetical protein
MDCETEIIKEGQHALSASLRRKLFRALSVIPSVSPGENAWQMKTGGFVIESVDDRASRRIKEGGIPILSDTPQFDQLGLAAA